MLAGFYVFSFYLIARGAFVPFTGWVGPDWLGAFYAPLILLAKSYLTPGLVFYSGLVLIAGGVLLFLSGLFLGDNTRILLQSSVDTHNRA